MQTVFGESAPELDKSGPRTIETKDPSWCLAQKTKLNPWSSRCDGDPDGDEDQIQIASDESRIAEVQKLMDHTWRRVSTRDRKRVAGGRRVPKGVRVHNVLRVENHESFDKYAAYKEMVKSRRKDTCERFAVCTDGHLGALDPSCSEMYLFHGTNPIAAESIARSDFSLSHAGKAAGKMFGPGIYLAEHASKSDEYATEGAGVFVKQCAMLICRAVGGRVFTVKDRGDQAHRVWSGEFDAVCGDRQAAVGTFREMIFYSEAAVYCEFIVLYSRIYDDEESAAIPQDAEGSLEALSDKEFAFAVVVGDAAALNRIDSSFKRDREFLLAVTARNPQIIDYMDKSLKDKKFLLQAVRKSSAVFKHIDAPLKADTELILQMVGKNSYVVNHISESLKEDREFLLEAIHKNSHVFRRVDSSLQSNREFMLSAVGKNSNVINRIYGASPKEDQEFLLEAIAKNSHVFQRVDPSLQSNQEFMLRAVAKNSAVIERIWGASPQQDQEFLLQAIAKNSAVFKRIDPSLQHCQEFILKALGKNSRVFLHLDASKRADKEFLLSAVQKNSAVFKHIDASLKSEEFVFAAVAKNPKVAEHAHAYEK